MKGIQKAAAELSAKEGLIFSKLKRFQDVSIAALFHTAWPKETATKRRQQQRIGAVLATLNRKIGYYDLKVVPGVQRGTYRLIRVIDRYIGP